MEARRGSRLELGRGYCVVRLSKGHALGMKWAILWFVLAVLFALGIGSFNLPLFNGLLAHGVEAPATAVKLTPEFHNTVRYEYQVDGKKFEGQDQSWLPNPPVAEIKVGQALVIYYDPQNPSHSVLGNPKPMLANELISVGMAALLFPTFIVFTLRQRLRRKLSKAS
jgi:hypothetical protein